MNIEEMKNDYGWCEAFGYAGDPDTNACLEDLEITPVIGSDTPVTPFSLDDVEEIIGSREGENDELEWLAVGKLKDGRYFYLEAKCDYTGWD